MDYLQEKRIVILGASRGIGRVIAIACAKAGASVVVSARSRDSLEQTRREVESYSHRPCEVVPCDITQENQVRELVQQIEAGGPVHGLVCAVGAYGPLGPFGDTSFREWEKSIQLNLIAPAHCVQSFIPLLKQSIPAKVILFTGGGQGPVPGFSSYVAAKGAIWRLTDTLGAELATLSIFINAIAPGSVNTQMLDEILRAGPEKVGLQTYQQCLKQKENGGDSPEKAANLCLYLLSDRSNGLYGKTLNAIWDDYINLRDLEALSRTDLFTMKRVLDVDGNTRKRK